MGQKTTIIVRKTYTSIVDNKQDNYRNRLFMQDEITIIAQKGESSSKLSTLGDVFVLP